MYPVMLNIDGKKCVVIGGGNVALRKAKKLKECGGNVVVISPEFTEGFENFTTVKKEYDRLDIEGAFVVTAATDDKELNRRIAADARSEKILAYAADDMEVSDFILPASKIVGDITVAASTNGKYPYLAKRLRDEISENIEFYNSILPYLAEKRKEILTSDCCNKKERLKELVSDDVIIAEMEKYNGKQQRKSLEFAKKIQQGDVLSSSCVDGLGCNEIFCKGNGI